MNITELKKDNTQYQAKITIPDQDIKKQIDAELSKIAKSAKMDGFRAGKVPMQILRQKYASSIRLDTIRDKMDAAVKKVIHDNKLNIALDPVIEDIKNKEDADLEFVIKCELLPEITLPDLKTISLEKPVVDIQEKDIDQQLDRILSFSKTYDKSTKAKAKKGDQVTMDAIGYVDGVAFEGGKLDTHKLVLGSNTFIPGFEDQLIGSKAGEEILVKVDFPKEYHAKELAGKPSEFKVKILEVHQETKPEINDELAKKFKCDNVAQLKEQITDNIRTSHSAMIDSIMTMRLFDHLEEKLQFEIPEALLAREQDILIKQMNKADQADSEIKDMSEEEKSKYFAKLALRRVRIGLMLADYVKQKKITINEEDIKQEIIKQARNYPGQEQQVIDFYQKQKDAVEKLKGTVLETKGVKSIMEEITLKEKLYTTDKLEKLYKKEMKD